LALHVGQRLAKKAASKTSHNSSHGGARSATGAMKSGTGMVRAPGSLKKGKQPGVKMSGAGSGWPTKGS